MPALAFLSRHPDCLWNIVILSMAATVAQLFISHTIKTFGALLFATVMTTRQFLSILLSCFMFFHPLSWGQMAATCIVFGALYYKNLGGGKKDAGKAGNLGDKEPILPQTQHGGPSEGQSALERLVAAGK
jgi:solute carrier family 35 (adenosine 3'-phospho 5'-phosphosulfate transporter), member B2